MGGVVRGPVASPAPGISSLPAGLVTFVLTDIEGSTRLLARLGDDYQRVLDRHRELVIAATAACDGHLVNFSGDGILLAFADGARALRAARDFQLALLTEPWPADGSVRVRVGIHSDEAVPRHSDYVALGVHQAARVSAAAHGGQVLVSTATAELVHDRLPDGIELRDLGRFVVRDFPAPERLFQLVAGGLPDLFPPPRTTGMSRHNLPVDRSTFIGRGAEVALLRALVAERRLVTITGPGGVGKTRLALEVARGAVEVFPDGVWLVELAAVRDAAGVVEAVAGALGIAPRSYPDALADLPHDVGHRRALVVLDNCEHVLAVAAAVVDRLLGAPGVHVLTTSREPLGIYGEELRRLVPLDVADASRLFADRAATGGGPSPDPQRVADVVRRLDGIPLAVELAAAATRTLTVEDVAARLDDRFRVLTARGAPPVAHHRTLRALVEWSHDRLDEHERVLFRRLSVFAGGCTLAGAESGCAGDLLPRDRVLDVLTALVDKSLVNVSPGVTGVARYSLLETLRLYGAEQLDAAGEQHEAQRHHLLAMAAFAREAREGLLGPDFVTWLRRCDEDAANVAAALDWPLDDAESRAARLQVVVGFAAYWHLRGDIAKARTMQRVIADADGLDPAQVLAAEVGLGWLWTNEDDASAVRERVDAMLRPHWDDPPGEHLAGGMLCLGWACANAGRLQEALATMELAAATARPARAAYVEALAPLFLSNVHAMLGNTREARAAGEQGLAAARAGGFMRLLINAQIDLGWAHLTAGDLDDAELLNEQALRAARRARSAGHESSALLNLAHVARLRGRVPAAATGYRDALTAARAGTATRDAAEALQGLVMLAAADHADTAAALAGAAARLRERTYPLEAPLRPAYDAAVAAATARLGQAAARAATDRGYELTDVEVDALVADAVSRLSA